MDKFTDVDFEEIQEDIYYTAVQVATIIGVDVSVIRSWTKPDTFENELDIKRVNGRRVFTKQDIENLKFIKDLRDKNFQIKLIKEWISKKGFRYAEYDGGLIDPKDPFGFDALSIKITEENSKQLKAFVFEIIKENQKLVNIINDKIESLDDKIAKIEGISIDTEESTNEIKNVVSEQSKVNEELSRQLEQVNKELATTKDSNKKLEDKLEEQSQQIKTNFDTMSEKIISENTKMVDDFKFKYVKLEQESEPKGLSAKISKIFHKKK